MADLGNYLEDGLVNRILRGITFTFPATGVSVSLHGTAGATESTADWLATELVAASAVSYARQFVAFAGWGAPVDGITSNLNEIAFPAAGSSWGLVTQFAIWDATTGGNLLYKKALTNSRSIGSGDVFRFGIGDLQLGFQ